MKNLGLYIHWPFCKSKCPYCDFNSHVREQIDLSKWNQAYLQELHNHQGFLADKNIISIFFGGGTPSLMPGFIVENIINELAKFAKIDDNIEITLEANPTSVESKNFQNFAQAGINRVSLGIQSLNPKNLKFLGREHSADEAIKAIEIAQRWFPRYSFDLIYALPEQDLKSWENELSSALKLANDHLSLYQLTIEKGTPFYSAYQQKKFQMPDEELARDFYMLTQNIMENANMPAYEVSNHAKANGECRHNMIYWQYDDFLGLGPGAHSRINNQAMHSIHHPENWLNTVLSGKSPLQNNAELSLEDKIQEFLIMGLRLNSGIKEQNFINKIGYNFRQKLNLDKLDYFINNKLLTLESGTLTTSREGRLVLNYLINQLIIS